MDPNFQMYQPPSMFLGGETVSSEAFSKVKFLASHRNSGRLAGGWLGSYLDFIESKPTLLFTPSNSE